MNSNKEEEEEDGEEEEREQKKIECIIEIKKNLTGHNENVLHFLFYGPPINRIITSSWDSTIIVFNLSYNQEFVYKNHTDKIVHVIKFNNKEFLSCSLDHKICCFSSTPPYELKKGFFIESVVIRMMKIDDDRFLCLHHNGELSLISYNSNHTTKELRKELICVPHSSPQLLLSKSHKNCFYINTNDKKNTIKLVNYDINDCVLEFIEHDQKNQILSMMIYDDDDFNEEILICGGMSKYLYFYRTSIENKQEKKRLLKSIKLSYPITTLFKNDKYCYVGDSAGLLNILEIRKNLEVIKIVREFICLSSIKDMKLILDIKNNSFVRIACAFDKIVAIFNISIVSPQKKIFNKEESKCIQQEGNELVSIINSVIDWKLQQSFQFLIDRDRTKNEISQFLENLEKGYYNTTTTTTTSSSSPSHKQVEDTIIEYKKRIFNIILQSVLREKENSDLNYDTFESFLCRFIPELPNHQLKLLFENKEDQNNLQKQQQQSSSSSKYIFLGQTTTKRKRKTTKQQNNNIIDIPNGKGIELKKKKRLIGSSVYSVCYFGMFGNTGMKHGTGKTYDPKSHHLLFEGEFQNGKKNGKGIEYLFHPKMKENISIFWGTFKNGKRDGRGEWHDLENKSGDNKVINGNWKNGVLEDIFNRYDCPVFSFSEIHNHLKNPIGSGGMGLIYKVPTSCLGNLQKKKRIFHSDDDDDNNNNNEKKNTPPFICVKVMKCRNGLEREIVYRMIKRAIELCSRIENSEHILEILGIFRGKGNSVGYIMRLCKMSVDIVISNSQGSLNMEERIRFLYEVAKGMNELHKLNFMHRDLKWSNCLISVNDVIKITDFDTLREDERDWKYDIGTLTNNIGTIGFTAPEVYLGMKEYGKECDVFSYGMMIYSILSELNQPFLSQYKCSCGVNVRTIISDHSLNVHIANCNLRPLLDQKIESKSPRFLIDLMVHCWDFDPFKRPSFNDIIRIFNGEKNRKRCYSIINFRIKIKKNQNNEKKKQKNQKIQQQQKMLLIEPKFKKIIDWLENKFEGSKVMYLDSPIIGEIRSDEDVLELLEKSKIHQNEQTSIIIDVKLDHLIEKEEEKDKEIVMIEEEEESDSKIELFKKIRFLEMELKKKDLEIQRLNLLLIQKKK